MKARYDLEVTEGKMAKRTKREIEILKQNAKKIPKHVWHTRC